MLHWTFGSSCWLHMQNNHWIHNWTHSASVSAGKRFTSETLPSFRQHTATALFFLRTEKTSSQNVGKLFVFTCAERCHTLAAHTDKLTNGLRSVNKVQIPTTLHTKLSSILASKVNHRSWASIWLSQRPTVVITLSVNGLLSLLFYKQCGRPRTTS